MLINSIIFGVYGLSRKILSPSLDDQTSIFISGVSAGIANSVICGPVELVKIQMQNQFKGSLTPRHKGPLECCSHIFKEQGFKGFFRGFAATVYRDAPSYGVYFTSYHFLKSHLLPKEEAVHSYETPKILFCGGIAGI